MLVDKVMTGDVVSVNVDESVEKCAALLLEHDISGLPVVDNENKVVGIITEGDLIRRAGRIKAPGYLEILGGLVYLGNPSKFVDELQRAMSLKAGELMTEKVYSINSKDPIEKGATIMLDKGIARLPVVDDDGKLIGIISRRDIMRSIYSENDN